MGKDHITTELTIEALAQENAEKDERIASLEADVSIYRAMAQESITALRAQTFQFERLQGQHVQLREEYRALRARMPHDLEAAA